MGFLEKGKKVEEDFVKLFGKPATYSTKEQDINEHWDVEIDGYKYDIKGVKKVNRDDIYPNELYHFVELKNVKGKKGWLYGDADYFAFETFKYFIIVEKIKLQSFIANMVTKAYVTSPDKSLYCLYTRKDNKDVITMITSIDLVYISERTMIKNTPDYNIGESVIPEIKVKERVNQLLIKKIEKD